MKIFLGLKEIAGYYHYLSKGFEKLGIPCTQIDLSDHPHAYPQMTDRHRLVLFDKYCYRRHEKAARLMRPFWAFPKFISRLFLFLWALAKHKVFVFGYATTFFHYRELPILKLFRKTIIYNFHGSDARPPYIDGGMISVLFPDQKINTKTLKKKTLQKLKDIKKIERWADHIINTDAQSLLFSRPFINNIYIGLPCEAPDGFRQIQSTDEPINILHAPSKTSPKGSQEIEEVINSLKKSGLPLVYQKVFNTTQARVLEQIQSCDFVVDQVYSDRCMAGVATESAFQGKPAVVCGYYAGYQTRYEAEAIPPTLFCQPDELKKAVTRMIQDRAFRVNLGTKAKDFVMRQRTPEAVAQKYLDIIHNMIPEKYMSHPQDNEYIFGYGLPKNKIKAILIEMIRNHGKEGLCLSHNKRIQQRLLDFARN